MTDFPTLPYTPTREIRTFAFIYLNIAWKRYPFQAGPIVWAIMRSTPRWRDVARVIHHGYTRLQFMTVQNFPQGYSKVATSFPRSSPTRLWVWASAREYLYLAWKVLAEGFNKSRQLLTKNWDYLLEIFYRIEQWPSQWVVKSSVVAKIQ